MLIYFKSLKGKSLTCDKCFEQIAARLWKNKPTRKKPKTLCMFYFTHVGKDTYCIRNQDGYKKVTAIRIHRKNAERVNAVIKPLLDQESNDAMHYVEVQTRKKGPSWKSY